MPSDLENAALAWRKNLLNNEQANLTQLNLVYNAAWNRINTDVSTLYARLAEAQASGDMDAQQRLQWRIKNTQKVADSIEAEMDKLAKYSAAGTGQMQRDAVTQAIADAVGLPKDLGLTFSLTRPNFAAVEHLVGFAGDGSPLIDVYNKHSQGAGKEMAHVLARNIAAGYGVRKTAAELRTLFNTNKYSATLVARTETLRSYRAAQHETYKKNDDLISGWYWISACDRRSCAACFAMHGTFHTLKEHLDEHPGGRCVAMPALKGHTRHIQSGEERLAALPAAIQKNILGQAMHRAWLAGDVTIDRGKASSIAGFQHSQAWGDSVHVRSLKSIVGEDKAKQYAEEAAAAKKAAQTDYAQAFKKIEVQATAQTRKAQKQAIAVTEAERKAKAQQAFKDAQAAKKAAAAKTPEQIAAEKKALKAAKQAAYDKEYNAKKKAEKIAAAQAAKDAEELAKVMAQPLQDVLTKEELAAQKKAEKAAKQAAYDKEYNAKKKAEKAAAKAAAQSAPVSAKTIVPPAAQHVTPLKPQATPKPPSAAAQAKALKAQAAADAKAQKALEAQAKKDAAAQKKANAAQAKADAAALKAANAAALKQQKAQVAQQQKASAAAAKQAAAQMKADVKASTAFYKQAAKNKKHTPWQNQNQIEAYTYDQMIAQGKHVPDAITQSVKAYKQAQADYDAAYTAIKAAYPNALHKEIHDAVVNANPHTSVITGPKTVAQAPYSPPKPAPTPAVTPAQAQAAAQAAITKADLLKGLDAQQQASYSKDFDFQKKLYPNLTDLEIHEKIVAAYPNSKATWNYPALGAKTPLEEALDKWKAANSTQTFAEWNQQHNSPYVDTSQSAWKASGTSKSYDDWYAEVKSAAIPVYGQFKASGTNLNFGQWLNQHGKAAAPAHVSWAAQAYASNYGQPAYASGQNYTPYPEPTKPYLSPTQNGVSPQAYKQGKPNDAGPQWVDKTQSKVAPVGPRMVNTHPDKDIAPVKQFSDPYAKQDWIRKQADASDFKRANVTAAERKAVYEYTGNSYYGRVNHALRNNEKLSPDDQRFVRDIDTAMTKFELPEAITVWRGMSDSRLAAQIAAKGIDNMQDEPYNDKAFMSTSIHESSSFGGGFKAIITLPKGSKAMYVELNSSNSREKEVLLPRDSHFVIEKVQYNPGKGYTEVFMTLIQD